jgi:hypothetical protein
MGVSWCEGKQTWLADIRVGHKTISLGRFSSKTDATIARKMAEFKYGFHKNHGRGEAK